MKKKAIHITVDENLIPKVDEKREETGHTRSSFINFVLNKFFKEETENRKAKA